ncbi:hypothetical protein IJG76_00665 [Candidatus Saccharibacteria bacterium]|nr:hypothetical protein [Candidatus Saccharibacteria bacterium]
MAMTSKQTNLSYLNQISTGTNAAPGKSLESILTSKPFIFSMIGVGVLVVVLIIVALVSSSGSKEATELEKLSTRLSNTMQFVKEYNSYAKSPQLRGDATVISSILTETKTAVDAEIAKNAPVSDDKKSSSETTEPATDKEEAKIMADATAKVEQAKLNGTFDRVYLNELMYLVQLTMIQEQSIMNSGENKTLSLELAEYYDSLSNLYTKLAKNAEDAKN